MSRNTDTLMAFLLGAIAGGAAALLLAPEKGEVTRGKIRQGAQDLYGRGRSVVDRGSREVRGRAGQLTGMARDRVQAVREGAQHQVSAVKEAVAEGRDAYRRELERGDAEQHS